MSDTEERVFKDYRMRARQLIATVRQGRKLTFSILDEDLLTGYLGGWDEDTYLVVVPNYEQGKVNYVLVPKQNILFIDMHTDRTFREEDMFEEMNKTVGPFKDHLNKTYPK